MSKNPSSITVLVDGETQDVENVKKWWYNGLTLIVLHHDDDESCYPGGSILD